MINAPSGLTFPTDLSGGIAVISVEPYPDNGDEPYAIKPLVGKIPDNAADHFNYSKSILYYLPGNLQAAEEIARALPVPDVELQEFDDLADGVDAKLVMGSDFEPYDIGA